MLDLGNENCMHCGGATFVRCTDGPDGQRYVAQFCLDCLEEERLEERQSKVKRVVDVIVRLVVDAWRC